MPSQAQLVQKAEQISKILGNNICAECPERHPTWASILKPPLPGGQLMGVFVCQKCYRHHYEMGTKYCEVKSVSLATEWSFKEVEVLAKTGNKVVNGIYEASMDDDWDNEKEIVTFDKEEEQQARSAFVRKKYLDRKYFSEPKYHLVMAKLNPNYEQERQERQTRRQASLSSPNNSSVLIPETPRVRRRGSVGNYSTVSPKTPDPKEAEKAKVQNTPQKQTQPVMETPKKTNSSDLKSQLAVATSATPQDARNLLGLASTGNHEMHRTPSRSTLLEKTPSRRSMLEKTPSRRSMLQNKRSSSVRNMAHGDMSSRASRLLGGARSGINDSDHDPGLMLLPKALQAGGRVGYGHQLEQQRQQPLGMRKTRSDLNLVEMNNSSRGRRTLLAGGSRALHSSSRNDHEHLLSTPGRAGGRQSMMNKSASSRSMRGERRSMAYAGGSMLQDNRGVAPSPRQSACTRGRRTTDLGDIGLSLLQDSRGAAHSSRSREPSSRGKRSTGLIEAGTFLLQDNRSYSPVESSSRGRRTTGDGNTRRQGQRRNSIGRPSREAVINQEERKIRGLPLRVKSNGSKKDPLRNSNHGSQSVRGGSSGNYKEATLSTRISTRQPQGSVGSNSSSAGSSSDDEFGDEKRNHSGLGRSSNSRDSSKNYRGQSCDTLDDPGKSKKYSRNDPEQRKVISQGINSRTKDPRVEKPGHDWEKHPSTRDVHRSRSFGDIDESDSDKEEKPDHVWKKQGNSKAARKKVLRSKSHDGADESRFQGRRADPRAMMLKKQKSRRSMRRLPNYDDSKLDGSLKDGSLQEGSMQDSSSGKKSSSRRRTRRSSSSRKLGNGESSSSVGKLDSVREDEKGNKESLRRSCSTGKLGALMASGLPDDDTLNAYADHKTGRRKAKLAGTSKQGSSKDLNEKYSKGLANIRVSPVKKRGDIKSRSASTGALGLLAMHADPANITKNVHSGFDQKVQDALKKKAASKKNKESENQTNKSSPMKDFDNDKYKSAMVAQWLVSQSAT